MADQQTAPTNPAYEREVQDVLKSHEQKDALIKNAQKTAIEGFLAGGHGTPDDLEAHNNADRDTRLAQIDQKYNGQTNQSGVTPDMQQLITSLIKPILDKQNNQQTTQASGIHQYDDTIKQLNDLSNSKVSNGNLLNRLLNTAVTNDPRNLLPNGKLGMEKAAQVMGMYQTQQQHQFDAPKALLDIGKGLQDMQNSTPEAKLDYSRREKEQTASIDAQAKQQEELAKANQQSEQSFNQIMNLSDNMASALKGAYAQQGGGGPIKGMIGNAKAALGFNNTGNIKGLKEVKRATAISYARVLAQGSRGAVTLFNSILQSMPDNKFTSEQAGTTLAEMGLTAYALHKGIRDLGLTKDQVNSYSPDQLRTLMEKEKIGLDQETQDKIYNGIAEKFKNIAPRKSVDLEGNVSNGNKSNSNDLATIIKNAGPGFSMTPLKKVKA